MQYPCSTSTETVSPATFHTGIQLTYTQGPWGGQQAGEEYTGFPVDPRSPTPNHKLPQGCCWGLSLLSRLLPSWQVAEHRWAGLCMLSPVLSGPGAGEVGRGGVGQGASHSVRECDCSWVSHSGQEAGLAAVGAGSPQGLHRVPSGGWAAHRCHCLCLSGVATAAAAWAGILRGVPSSQHSCSPGGSQAGWGGPGWWHRDSHCSGKHCWPPVPPQRWALY